MDAATGKTRLGRLKELLSTAEFKGLSQDRIAELLGLPSGNYLSRLLSGRKGFGERTARRIERGRGLPAYWFDNVESVRFAEPSRVFSKPITPSEADVGREWGKLREPLRSHFVRAIELAVADQANRDRSQKKKKRGVSDGDRPHSS